MSRLRTVILETPQALREHVQAWNDLWRRSAATIPTVRAEFAEQWLKTFAAGKAFRIIAVCDERGTWLGLLPLVQTRLMKLRVGGVPSNAWGACGDFLLDSQADAAMVCDEVLRAWKQLPWSLLSLSAVLPDTARWQALLDAVQRAEVPHDYRDWMIAAQVHMPGDWEDYRQTWSPNHRRNMQRQLRKLQSLGDVRLAVHDDLPPEDVAGLLRHGFELENAGWKGREHSSVIGTPGMWEFHLAQAQELARCGELVLSFLQVSGEDIAFQYGFCANGVYHAMKAGYSETHAALGPGQTHLHLLLEQLFNESQCRAADLFGPLSESISKWTNRTYRVGRLLVAPRGGIGRLVLAGYRKFGTLVRRLRGKGDDLPLGNQHAILEMPRLRAAALSR